MKKSILEELGNSKGYDTALFTTFNFDPIFFENRIISVLLLNNIKKISLFVDAKELNKSISITPNNGLGKKYSVFPIDIAGAFHPKIILLLGEEKAKLIVSSANIKDSSYINNVEVFNCFEYSKNDKQFGLLINDAIKTFISLHEIFSNCNNYINRYKSYDLDIINFLKSKEYDFLQTNNIFYLDNLKQPIIESMEEIIGKSKIEQIRIAVPFYDKQLKGLTKIKEAFKCNAVELYINNIANNFPIKDNIKGKIIKPDSIKVFESINKKKVSFYHGKVIELKTRNKSYILYGSTNCSMSALASTYKNGGNIECSILYVGKRDEFDDFFDSFNISDDVTLSSSFSSEPEQPSSSIVFLYGKNDSNKTVLLFKIPKKINDVNIFFGDRQISDYSVEKDILIVYIENDVLESDKNSYITFKYNKTIENIYFWYSDENELNIFRYLSGNYNLIDIKESFEDEESANSFIIDIMEILNKYDIKEQIEDFFSNKTSATVMEESSETPDGFDEDVGDIEYYSNEEYIQIYTKPNYFIHYSKGINFLNQSSFFRKQESVKSKPNENGYVDDKSNDKKKITFSSNNKISRLIKRFIRNINNMNDYIPNNAYVDLTDVLLCFLDYNFYSGKINMQYMEYIITKNQIIKERFNRLKRSEYKYKDDNLIDNMIYLLTDIGYAIKEENFEYDLSQLKTIMIELDKEYNIRSSLNTMIKKIDLTEIGINDCSRYEPYEFVDSLFGYKTDNQLKTYLYNKYKGCNVKVFTKGKTFNVEVKVDSFKNYVNGISLEIIKNIINSISMNSTEISEILLSHYKENGDYLEYYIQFVKSVDNINFVKQRIYSNKKMICYDCRKDNEKYYPKRFND